MSNRLYFDNAATSWPKPECVYEAMDRYQREVGAAAGRGGYTAAIKAQRLVDAARRNCAKLIGASDPKRIVFTSNGTDALNLAIHGTLRKRDHAVTSEAEHNSVLRPLFAAQENLGVAIEYARCDENGLVDLEHLQELIDSGTNLLAINHASNVTGAVQPLERIAEIVRASNAVFLVDAAQTAGHVPIDVEKLGIDLLATSGHKGLLGPLGTGILYIREGLEELLVPSRQGGTGVESLANEQPRQMPERYEAGNLNVPALAGLAASTEFLLNEGVEKIAAHEQALTEQLLTGLQSIPGVEVVGPPAESPRVSVVSFRVNGYDPQELAATLDAAAELQCRAGLHCAPRIHQCLGTADSGGLVRLSLGWSTTADQV
ncbi:MAG: aminotransferase class V-fold PLP-dependent enzyme, partial [Lacipirellulaceae bacterium]